MQIDGVSLTDSQARFYQALKARDAASARRFLVPFQKKSVLQKNQKEDALLHLKKESVDISALFDLDNAGIHNFSIGCLDAYCYLTDAIAAGKAFLLRGRILVLLAHGVKTFVFNFRPEDLPALTELQKLGVIYSIDPIPGLQKQAKFVEIAYPLKALFDRASYKNNQKYRTRVVLPVERAGTGGLTIEPLSVENLGWVRLLHDQWVDHKLADERTYQIMFPRARYIRCAELAVRGPAPGASDAEYRGFVFRDGNEAVAVRVFSVERGGSGGRRLSPGSIQID